MSKLNIVEVRIEDSLSQLAKTCTLTLAPATPENPPVAEFGYPGDEIQQSATSIRPHGSIICIVGSYGGLPTHTLFRGSIEYMDDLEDPDQLTYKIILSQVPQGFPHRQKRSAVWNMTEKGEELGWNSLSSNTILNTICNKAGITLGRNDIPEYTIWGTYEVIQQSPIEVAQQIAAPFNQSEHEKYYVRMDMNGLQIIKVNYGESYTEIEAYPMEHMLSRQSNYQIFIPDKSADGDVLLSGGDKYFDTLEATGRWVINAVHTYEESSQDAQHNIISHAMVEERYTEKTTEVKFVVELLYQDESIADDPNVTFPAVPENGTDINNIIQAVKDGDFNSVTILESMPWHIIERRYGPIHGVNTLTSEKETFVTYETKQFKGDGSVDSSFMETERTVITFDQSIESSWCPTGLAPIRMTRNWYNYDNVGNTTNTITINYLFVRGAWSIEKVDVQGGDSTGITNSTIQFYLNAWNSYSSPPDQPLLPKKGTRISSSKTPLCRYQLLNGEILKPLVLPKRFGQSTFSVDAEYIKALGEARAALQIGCPGMDYTGLRMVWEVLQEALIYQTDSYYWHIINGNYSIDTTPTVGESLKVGGATGICESYSHTITENEALTQVTLRRLVKK